MSVARAQLGKPYQWNTAGPDTFDCSGLTMYAYAAAGIQLIHWTGSQAQEGVPVALDQMASGDLVFFGADYHHVGIYIGGGQMIDAPHTGSFVQVDPVWSTASLAIRVTG